MPNSNPVASIRRTLRHSRWLQVLALIAIWYLAEMLVHWLHVPISGGVAGLLLLLALFASGRFSPRNLRRGAMWFLAEMLLFFIPAVPAIINHREFLGWLGIKVLIVILAGTLIVMVTTALVVELYFRWFARQARPGPMDGAQS